MTLLLALWTAAALQQDARESRHLVLPPPVLGLDVFDADGDGVTELMVAREEGIEFLSLSHENPGEVLGHLPRGDSRTFTWSLGEDSRGAPALYVLRDPGEVLRWDVDEGEAVLVHRDTQLALPAGVYPFDFVRDLRGLGKRDLALVHRGGVQVAFANDEGWTPGATVRHHMSVSWDLGWPKDLPIELEQTLVIPSFSVEDQNADGVLDLIFEHEDAVQFFWTRDGRLPQDPTFELDLRELRSRLPQPEGGSFNTSNLLEALESRVSHEIRDLDGDGRADLMLQMGPKVVVYGGTDDGIDRSKARQVLRTSGNLLSTFSTDVNDDARLDLCMLHMQDISLAQVLMWVVIGGSIEFELFVYNQESSRPRFSRSPSSHRTLNVKFGPILSVQDDLEEPIEQLRRELVTVPVPGDYDGDGAVDDLAVLREGRRVAFYQDMDYVGGESWSDVAWKSVIARFDRLADGDDSIDVNLEELVGWSPFSGRELFDEIEGEESAYEMEFTAPDDWKAGEERLLFSLDIGPDDTDDVLLVESSERDAAVLVTLRVFTGE